MRVKKKLLGIAGVALCSMLVLGACGNSSDEGTGEKKEVAINHDSQFPIIKEGEELTLNIMAPGVGLAEWEDMPTLQDYQEKLASN